MLEKLDHGHHVLRIYCKSLVARMYEKFATFLRLEICVNRLKDLGLNKGLENLTALRQRLVAVTDRLADFEADLLDVHVDFPLFQRLALPILVGRSKIPGIKIQDTRMMHLMEVLLHGGSQLVGWRTAQIHESIQAAFGLTAEQYTLTQLRYDLRKMRATACCSAMVNATVTGSPKKGSMSPPCSSCSTSASAARWPTRSFTIVLRRPPHRRPRSKRPITGPMPPSRGSWISSRHRRANRYPLPSHISHLISLIADSLCVLQTALPNDESAKPILRFCGLAPSNKVRLMTLACHARPTVAARIRFGKRGRYSKVTRKRRSAESRPDPRIERACE
jgi:hypothetical protein